MSPDHHFDPAADQPARLFAICERNLVVRRPSQAEIADIAKSTASQGEIAGARSDRS
jgi:hypothetical protein